MASSTKTELASLDRLQDRIDSASNEKLQELLRYAVPALVKLVNEDELRARVFKMFGPLLKRLKNLTTCNLPLEALVALVRQEHQPYACNFSMTFLDVAWVRQQDKSVELTVALLDSILEWPLYSPQSNALLAYTWQVIPHLPAALALHRERHLSANIAGPSVDGTADLKHILSDYLLDLCLVHSKQIKRGTAGSVLPGLSDERVIRLTAKKEDIEPTADLRAAKLAIVELLLDNRVFSPWAAVAISTVLSYDSDANVAQAASFKMNAQGNRKDLKAVAPFGEPSRSLIGHILHIACPASAPLSSEALTWTNNCTSISPYSKPRSALRDEIRSHLIRWCAVEGGPQVCSVSRAVLKIFVDTTLTVGAITVRFRTAVVLLANSLTEHTDDASFIAAAQIVLSAMERVLEAYTTRSTEVETSDGITTRKSCYAMLERIANRAPLLAIRSASVVSILFRLLDTESETLVPKLYGALGALREAYQNRLGNVDNAAPIEVGVTSTAESNLDADVAAVESEVEDKQSAQQIQVQAIINRAEIATKSSQKLQEVIIGARSSNAPKKRLAALQWARAVFDWDLIAMQTLVVLADDASQNVTEAAAKEFSNLRDDMTEARAHILIGIIASPDIRDVSRKRWIARVEVFRSLSSWFQQQQQVITGLKSTVNGTGPGTSAVLIGGKTWTDVLKEEPGDAESEYFLSLMATLEVVCQEEASSCKSEALKAKVMDTSAELLSNMLQSGNNPALRVKARMYDTVIISWFKHTTGASLRDTTTSIHTANILGHLCLDSLDTFIGKIKTALMGVIDEATAAAPTPVIAAGGGGTGLNKCRLYKEQQLCNGLRTIASMLEACEARLHVKAYNSLVQESKELQKVLFGIYHDVLKPANGYSNAVVVVALQTYSQILRHEVFLNKMLEHVITFNAIQPPYDEPAPSSSSGSVPIHERIFAMVQGYFKNPGLTAPLGGSNAASVAAATESTASASKSGNPDGEKATLAALGIGALGNYCTWGMDTAANAPVKDVFVGRVWGLVTSRAAWQVEHASVRFSIAETMFRMATEVTSLNDQPILLTQIGASASASSERVLPYEGARALSTFSEAENRGLPVTLFTDDSSMSAFAPSVCMILSMVDSIVIESVLSEASAMPEKGTAATLLLVFVRHYASLCRTGKPQQFDPMREESAPPAMSLELLQRVTDVLLRLLNDSQSFTQDVACLGLCHLHNMAKSIPGVSANNKTAVELLSTEVINTLAREKRSAPPPGMAVSHGTGTGSQDATATGSNGASSTNDGSSGSAGSNNSVSTPASRDALAAAAATAAAEMGLNIEDRAALERAAAQATDNPAAARPLPAWRQRDVNPGNYGVYSTAIKVARKSGDASVVFGVLSLIRRDPSFGAAESDTEALYKCYMAPHATVERSKIKSLLPMLMLAKNDPYKSVRDVMKALWNILVTPEYQRFVIPLQAKI